MRSAPFLGINAACNGNSLLTFRDNLSSRVKGCPEAPVKNYHSTLRNFPQEHGSQFAVLLFWVFFFNSNKKFALINCAALPLLFSTAHAITKAFTILWDELLYSLLISVRVIAHRLVSSRSLNWWPPRICFSTGNR